MIEYSILGMSQFHGFQSVSWSNVSYSLTEFLEAFSLPRLVKIHEGHFDPVEQNVVSANDVYNLEAINRVETVLLETLSGVETRVPVDFSCNVERVPDEFVDKLLTLEDLTKDHSVVKFVRVVHSDPSFECLITRGEKLKVKKQKSRGNFVTFKRGEKERSFVKVPISCEAKFQALLDGEEMLLAKLLKKVKLPTWVRFVNDQIMESGDEESKQGFKGPESGVYLPGGVVKVKGVFSDSFITATTVVKDAISTVSFPKSLAISVVPSATQTAKSDPLELKSPFEHSNVIIEADDEGHYEDMSGILKTMKELPQSRSPTGRGREKSDLKMTLETVRRQGALPNTYSPSPSKVTRSNSLLSPSSKTTSLCAQEIKRRGSLQRATSNLELNFTTKADNIYEEIPVRSSSGEVEFASAATDKSRRACSTDYQPEPSSLQEQDQKHRDGNVPARTVPLRTLEKFPTLNPTARMVIFGRNVTGEDVTGKLSKHDESHDIEDIHQSDHPGQFPNAVLSRPGNPSCISDALKQSTLFAKRVGKGSEAEPCLVSFREESNLQMTVKQEVPFADKENETQSSVGIQEIVNISNTEIMVKQELQKKLPQVSEELEMTQSKLNFNSSQMCRSKDAHIALAASTTPEVPKRSRPPVPIRKDENIQATRPEVPPRINSLKKGNPPNLPTKKESPLKSKPALPAKNERIKPNEQKGVSTPLLNAQTQSQEQRKDAAINFDEEQQNRRLSNNSDKEAKTAEAGQSNEGESKSFFAIPNDLSKLRVSEVLQCLELLNMQQFQEIFSARQVDGNMLVCLDEEALESFGMDRFHRLKLLKVINDGWRPQL